MPVHRLGAAALGAAVRRAGLEPHEVEMVLMGHAMTAGCGSHTARQAAHAAELPATVDCTGVNKGNGKTSRKVLEHPVEGCASGLKAITLAAQAIAMGQVDVALCGGMDPWPSLRGIGRPGDSDGRVADEESSSNVLKRKESMSQVPYFLRHARRGGYHYGHGTLEDSALSDGLWDATSNCHLSSCVEHTVEDMPKLRKTAALVWAIVWELGLNRAAQDRYALESYAKAAKAWQQGAFDLEVAPVRVKNPAAERDAMEKRSIIMSDARIWDGLGPAFGSPSPALAGTLRLHSSNGGFRDLIDGAIDLQEDGTITAANASSLNDGAAALVLISEPRARDLGITGLARICAFADAAVEPRHVAKAPAAAIGRALSAARMNTVNFYEIHETFSAVALANMQLLDLDPSRVNVNGGAVALGHPIGASGARIVATLLSVLTQQDATTGCAAIGNVGGGATALVLDRR
ncbi:Acetyl-CoA acetyltransferase [Durusdinium trenchii]|uniref:Cytosolic 1 (Cytosolic acetoacetyl-CoA thiolase 1) (Thiolase 1) (Protein EMBRYO DEFECTIVE 1276) n=1 Tax=Durusdinium trenchii TaxID=1381693 RepID=A0ABP0QQL2_9DINO